MQRIDWNTVHSDLTYRVLEVYPDGIIWAPLCRVDYAHTCATAGCTLTASPGRMVCLPCLHAYQERVSLSLWMEGR